jgi:nucleoside-diphosphate-sugar epimerase
MDAICHLATCKEDRGRFFDTSIRGTFLLLDAAKRHGRLKHFLLASGDAALGIFFRPQPIPLSESAPLAAYPGYYAFSKVMEEVMLEQYRIQYGLPATVLRISWVHAEDDVLAHMTLKPPHFGGPAWSELATTPEQKRRLEGEADAVGCLVHPDGRPFVRHIVGLADVMHAFLRALGNPAAVGQTFNIAAPAPFSYDVLAGYIARKLGLEVVPFTDGEHHDFSIDISKARSVLGYEPKMDAFRIVDEAIAFRSAAGRRSPLRYVG